MVRLTDKLTATLTREEWNVILSSLEGLEDNCWYDTPLLIKKIEKQIEK